MAGRKVRAIRPVSAIQVTAVEDEATQRAIDVLTVAIDDARSRPRVVIEDVDLAIGTNKIPHGLGRRVVGCHVTPTTASAAFAYAIDKTNPRPDLEIWLAVVGTVQSRCVVEVW